MANSYSWIIDKVYTKNITVGGKSYSSVIARVEATLKTTSGTDSSISVDHGVDLDLNTNGLASGFTAYADVSEDNVKSWIETKLTDITLASIKEHKDNEISFEENIKGATAQGSTDSDGKFTASFPWS